MLVRDYLQGAINYMRATFRPTASVELAEQRYSQCLVCPHRVTKPYDKCSVCNCYLPKKVLLFEQSCPIGRW